MENNRIVVDPRIMAGKPVVRGTRIPVDLVLKRLSQDLDLGSLFESYPRLTEDDVKACLAYAYQVIQGEDGVRTFYPKRDSTGAALDGAKLTRRMRFEGEQLKLESENGKRRTIELLTLVPARSQLIHAIHFEHELLKKPLELKLVYDRSPKTP